MDQKTRKPFVLDGQPVQGAGGEGGERETARRPILCTITELTRNETDPMALYAHKTFSPDLGVDRNNHFNELYPTMIPLEITAMKKLIW